MTADVNFHDQDLSLKQTNASRPQIRNTNSKQSITASEDYYSFSDENAPSESDERDRVQRQGNLYQTPPSRHDSPDQDHVPSQPVAAPTTSQLRSAGRRRAAPEQEVIREVSFDEQSIRRKELAGSSREGVQQKAKMDRENTTTPGVDDTPYIRFAIDQLTRDEEVRGTRTYQQSRAAAAVDADDDYPVDRIVPNEYVGRGSEYTGRSNDYSVPSSEQTGYGDYSSPASYPPRGEQYANRGAEQPIRDADYPPPMRTEYAHEVDTPPSRHPDHRYPKDTSTSQRDTFVPFHPPYDSVPHPPLRFLPAILRPLWLGLFIFLVLLMLVGLMFCAIWSPANDGLWTYDSFGDGRYFVFQYLPTMLGMVILTWLMQVQTAVQRIVPFKALASASTHARNQAVFLDLYPSQFLIPDLQYFRGGQGAIGSIFIAFWLFLFTIPLLASAFTVRFYGEPGIGDWRWVAVQGVIWTTVALYIILLIALVFLGWTMWRGESGLRWDPRSLADIIALHERANIMSDYAGSEVFHDQHDFKHRLSTRTDRLGYWFTTQQNQDVFYSIGEEGGATRRYSIEQGRIREKAPEKVYPDPTADIEAQTGSITGRDFRDPTIRRRYLPWYLKTTWILAWIVVAFILLIAFYVVSFVNDAVKNGFSPDLDVAASADGFSAANFLYSFIPALIGTVLYLLYQPLDLAIRRLAPFAELSSASGAPAERSILLDYPYRLPVSVTIGALTNGHLTVALASLVSLANITLPILGGGIFWAQWYTDTESTRISAHLSGLYALCFFLALYAVSLLPLVPRRSAMALPHDAKTLAELTSWIYMSNLLNDRQFSRAGGNTKAEFVTRLLGLRQMNNRGFLASLTSLTGRNFSRTALAAEKRPEFGRKATGEATHGPSGARYSRDSAQPYKYGFGIFIGRDGREHLGIDRVERSGAVMMMM